MDILNGIVAFLNYVFVPGVAYGSQLALGALGAALPLPAAAATPGQRTAPQPQQLLVLGLCNPCDRDTQVAGWAPLCSRGPNAQECSSGSASLLPPRNIA